MRFQRQWHNIDNTQWIPVTQDKDVADRFEESGDLVQSKASTVKYLKSVLDKKSYPRDDYAELILLSFIFLGGVSDNPVTIRTPGAFHQARWMAKAIYALKIYLLRDQINLTVHERKAMCSIGLFVTLCYVRYWNESMIARYAPKNDLDFMCNLESGLPDRSLTEIALTAWKRHLWYVSEEMVGLAFLDKRVNLTEKTAMIQNLKRSPKMKALKRLEGKNFSPRQPLSEFVTAKTMTIFSALLPDGTEQAKKFLEKLPQEWDEDNNYKQFKMACDKMKVVNDCAERAIALVTKFNSALTKDEQQKQYLLSVVRQHQRDMPSCSKETFND